MTEHAFDRAARELADVGTSAIALAPNVNLVFTVRDSEHEPGEKLLHTELVTGEYHKATLILSASPILPPDVPWGGGVHTAVCEVWGALDEATANFQLASELIAPAVPHDPDEGSGED